MRAARPAPYTLQPTPYNLYPTTYTLHPTPYTLHPTPCTLQPTPCAGGNEGLRTYYEKMLAQLQELVEPQPSTLNPEP